MSFNVLDFGQDENLVSKPIEPLPEPVIKIPGEPGKVISVRQNNPGNLKYVGQSGAKEGARGFAAFETPEAGFNALQNQIEIDKKRGLTLSQFGYKYAPPHENDTVGWVNDVASLTGYTPETPLATIPTKSLAAAVAKRESGTVVTGESPTQKSTSHNVLDFNSSMPDTINVLDYGLSSSAPAVPEKPRGEIKEEGGVTFEKRGGGWIPIAEKGLEEPTYFNPPLMAGGLGGMALKGGLSPAGRTLVGFLGGETGGAIAQEALPKDTPMAVRIPLELAAAVAGGKIAQAPITKLTVPLPTPSVFGKEPLQSAGWWQKLSTQPEMVQKAMLQEAVTTPLTAGAVSPATAGVTAQAKTLTEEFAPVLSQTAALPSSADLKKNLSSIMKTGISKEKAINDIAEMLETTPKLVKAKIDKRAVGTEVGDIAPRVLGEYSPETAYRFFSRLDDALPGAKEKIWYKQKYLEKVSKEAVDEVVSWSRNLEGQLPSGSGRTIMLNAIAQQKGGKAILKGMNITEVPPMSPQQEGAYNLMRGKFDEFFDMFNKARVAAGKDPIDKVDNYFTFFRRFFEANKEGVNPVLVRKEWFSPFVKDVAFATERVPSSELPILTDAFKVFRRYTRGVVPWSYQAPHHREVLDLAGEIGNVAPNAAYGLKRWVSNIQGSDIPRALGLADRTVRKLINNTSVATLGGYVRSALAQPFAAIWSATEIGPQYMIRGSMEALIPQRFKFAKAASNVLKTREFDVNIADALEQSILASKLGRFKKGLTTASYIPLHALDSYAATSTWLGAHARAIAKGIKNPIMYADEVVTKTQGSAARSDISQIQTHTIGKALTQFQTFIINEFDYIARELLGIKNPNITKVDQLRKVINLALAGSMANIVAEDVLGFPSPMPTPLRAMKQAKQEGERGMGVAGAGLAELAQVVPVVGGAARYGSGFSGPFLNILERVGRGEAPWYKEFSKFAGIPGTTQAWRLLPFIAGDVERSPTELRKALFGKTRKELQQDRFMKDMVTTEERAAQSVKEPMNILLEKLLGMED